VTLFTTQETTEDPIPVTINDALESRRKAVYNAVVNYVNNNYKPEDSGVSVFSTGDKIVVVISSEKPNLRNFWSGRWTSAWTIVGNKVAGNIKIHAHYFEDGNVQLQTAKAAPEKHLQGNTDAAFADAFVAFVNVRRFLATKTLLASHFLFIIRCFRALSPL
jgi:hypothetical protein